MTERGQIEAASENMSVTSLTQDVAAQAWDKSNFRGVCSRGDKDVSCVDFGNEDIYNPRRGNHELNAGNNNLTAAENGINRVVDKIMSGNYDTRSLVAQLNKTGDRIDDGVDNYRDGIRDLAAGTKMSDLKDLADGRSDAMVAGRSVDKAIDYLKHGNEALAVRELMNSLYKIDAAKNDVAEGRDGDDRHTSHGRGNDRDRDHGYDRGRDHGYDRDDDNGYHRGGRNDRGYTNDGRMRDHMYDLPNDRVQLDPAEFVGGLFGNLHGRGRSGDGYNNGAGNYDRYASGNGLGQLNPFDPNSVENFVSNQTGIDVRGLTQTGDQISRIVDPIGVLPRPSELTDPGKFIGRVLRGPLDLFG